ncbi:hypothetical protein CRUP_035006, partial [Coryphaenoides rupestris]
FPHLLSVDGRGISEQTLDREDGPNGSAHVNGDSAHGLLDTPASQSGTGEGGGGGAQQREREEPRSDDVCGAGAWPGLTSPAPMAGACCPRAMPPRKKRRPSSGEDMSAKKSRQDSVFSRKQESPQIREEELFSSKRCLEWFYEYAGCDDVVGPEGMEKFCEDIGVEPENVVMLVLAWRLDAQSMGYFTLQEWLKGMSSLQCDSTESLRNSLDHLRSVLNDATSFKLIYRYAFDFAREKDQRSLDLNTAKCMLGLLLGKTWPLFPVFNQFLEVAVS